MSAEWTCRKCGGELQPAVICPDCDNAAGRAPLRPEIREALEHGASVMEESFHSNVSMACCRLSAAAIRAFLSAHAVAVSQEGKP